ncbi:hypothetical protein SZN_09406 [Streptomyces zinciresistens K42]|uniref:Uncharacterized protein n=1 Tax=Streptomyces zinciresistens K42 TaxID=700597 RepID=G2G8R3_9ACTN|nr:hypothetical protein [Streptomyces zinciresistens]EGX60128.1 hypothetical protein SZN_09406 [Streptomyces zinciresistens K42]
MICTLCSTHQLDHGRLCPDCARTTLGRLAQLPRLWATLEAWLSPGTAGPAGPAQYGGRTRMAEAPMPLNQEVLDLRGPGGIIGVLEDWREAIHSERHLPVPARTGSLWYRLTRASAGLQDQVHFIVLWEQGGQLALEVRHLVDRVRAVVQPGRALDEPPEPTFLGYCIAVDEGGIICGRRLWADLRRTVQCGWCLCQYPPDTWLALRRFQPGNHPPPGEQPADGRAPGTAAA